MLADAIHGNPTGPELGVCILAAIGLFALLYFIDRFLSKYFLWWKR